MLNIEFLVDSLFLFQNFEYITSPSSGSIGSDEKSVINYIIIALCIIECFSLVAFKTFSLSFKCSYDLTRYISFCVYPSWSSLNFLDLQIIFIKFGKYLDHFFKNILSLSLSPLHLEILVYMLELCWNAWYCNTELCFFVSDSSFPLCTLV